MRAFYTSVNGCCELVLDKFPDESEQHAWFEENLPVLFPNLKLIGSEMTMGETRLDTVAYDAKAKTFVAIEYKNRQSGTVREQAEDYLNKMHEHPDTLIVAYIKKYGIQVSKKSFHWKNMYVIIVAPGFSKRQKDNADKKDDECLYELKRFENGFVTLRFMAGKRGPIDAQIPEKSTVGKTSPIRETSGAKPGRSLNTKDWESKNPFYATFRDRVLSAFPGMNEKLTKSYVRFGRDGEKLLCGVVVQRRALKVYYGRKGDDFTEDDFVENVSNRDRHGIGHYRTSVRNKSDLERLLPILRQVKTANH